MNLGLYGTLLDPDVRALVLGEAWRDAGRPALLRGWERLYVEGQVYPGIRPAPGAEIDVLVLTGVDPAVLAQADAFEGDEYKRQPLRLTFYDAASGQGDAMFYVPVPGVALTDEPWQYDDEWRARHHARFMQEARAAMAGRLTLVKG
jgi:gamma-glutamylcyclotransferase (GGCT)/AIG2-like uncharacterized protein YtfP